MYTIALTVWLLAPVPVPSTQDWLDRVLAAAKLPVAAAEAREEGVSDLTLREYLDRVLRNRVPADDAYRILDEEVRVVRAGGPKENFGAFVQTQLDAGLRGRALADAIHEEHRKRGMGRPDDRSADRNDDRRPDNARPGQPGQGRPDEARERDRAQDRDRDNRPNQSRDTTRKDRKP